VLLGSELFLSELFETKSVIFLVEEEAVEEL